MGPQRWLMRTLVGATVLWSTVGVGVAAADLPQTIGTFPPIETSISLPRDEGSHRQPAEWWYMTGHLHGIDPAGRAHEYGYELVVFQIAPIASAPPIYDSHFAVSDLTRGTFSYEEKVLPGQFSGARNRVDLDIGGFSLRGTMGRYRATAARSDGRYGLDLQTSPDVAPTLNGVDGVETFGDWTSPYYSFTSNTTTGTLMDHGVPVRITGTSWYDHEWATGAPGTTGTGWTWFGVSLDDNVQYNLSFFQNAAGVVQKVIAVRTGEGRHAPVPADQVTMTPLRTWTSPHTGHTYPISWRIGLPGGAVTITSKIADSELVGGPGHKFYYEGPAWVSGTLDGRAVAGNAYAEMNPRGVDWGPTRVLP